ncbi:hypothetical protein ACGF13_20430 [Kitasatospora sp. NPDC048286]|uniref:hypothetical protein n=1 Tax=Kitasatospora sp. NPDC048286 TaxID=3364047 RepID=UPI00371A923A
MHARSARSVGRSTTAGRAKAGFAFGFGLAPDHAQGQYQGLAGIGFGAGQALAPVILTGAVLALGHTGWLLLGALFAVVGAAGPPVAAWAERTRPGKPEASVERRRRGSPLPQAGQRYRIGGKTGGVAG